MALTGLMPLEPGAVTAAGKNCNIQLKGSLATQAMSFSPTTFVMTFVTRTRAALSLHNLFGAHSAVLAMLVLLQRHSGRRNDVYNILWAVVFGFATLNILGLSARRFEANRRGFTFGELMAVLIVLLSIFLLGWELLGVFHIFPIKLQR
jgi:hypothetical protein